MAQGDLLGVLTGSSANTGATNDLTGSVSVAVDDLICVVFGQQVNLTATGVTDNLGNTYTAQNAGSDAGNMTGRAFYSLVTTGGTLTTVTVAATASANDMSGRVGVFEGPFDDPPIDANPANVTSDATSPFACPATGTLTKATEVVVVWGVANIATSGSTSWSATSPNLLASSGGTANVIASLGYQTVAATTSIAPEFTAVADPSGNVALGTMSFMFTAAGSTYTLDAASATYAYTATAAGLEFDRQIDAAAASYIYTATAAGLEFDRQIVPESAAYTWTVTDADLEYDQILNADSAAYTWTPTDASLEYTPASSTYELAAESAAYLWTASDAGFTYVQISRDTLKYGAAPHTLPVARVQAKWDEIEGIERRIAAKQAEEREKKRQLAELEAKKRQTRTIIERRRKLEARIEAYETEIAELRTAMVELLDQIERLRTEVELQQTMALRRRRLMLMMAAAV